MIKEAISVIYILGKRNYYQEHKYVQMNWLIILTAFNHSLKGVSHCSYFAPLAHFLLSPLQIQINVGITGSRDPQSCVLDQMPDPDIAGHHEDKNTQTDGRVRRQGGEAASSTKDFRGEESCNYSCLPTSAFYVVSKAFNGCPFRDNDLPQRYKCKDNDTQSSGAVVEMTPCFYWFQ